MMLEIHKLLGEGKVVAASTIQAQGRTPLRQFNVGLIKRKKEIVNHKDDENENKEIDNSDDNIFINNDDSKEDNES